MYILCAIFSQCVKRMSNGKAMSGRIMYLSNYWTYFD